WILPITYVFTSWITRFDYILAPWTVGPAVSIFVLSLLLRWRAHKDLSSSWSHTLELADFHRLVTTGVYSRVRHPLYASLVLWAAAQPVLLQNFLAGLGGALAVGLLWQIRVPAEEEMMRERFGAQYDEYAHRTGRLIPRFKKPGD
ncbi:MAG TPA: protein-S-isoprenylcysteine O-methyltransferase, partial [Anaerolineales bacterium]|nr:protein-S-isoprenylcysteine O-methyltransferase [Anaerolineales bacterium]